MHKAKLRTLKKQIKQAKQLNESYLKQIKELSEEYSLALNKQDPKTGESPSTETPDERVQER